jgi:hypothetical protein
MADINLARDINRLYSMPTASSQTQEIQEKLMVYELEPLNHINALLKLLKTPPIQLAGTGNMAMFYSNPDKAGKYVIQLKTSIAMYLK